MAQATPQSTSAEFTDAHADDTTSVSWLSSPFSAIGTVAASVSEWTRSTGKRYLQTTTDGLWIATEPRRFDYDIGERDEAFFGDPEGPEYHFKDDLTQTEEDSIRLLELLKGERDDDVVCRMHTVPLSDHPPYEALSYYWGSDEPIHPIGIQSEDASKTASEIPTDGDKKEVPWHDLVFKLQSNIRCALRHIRYPDRSRLVWVDAICINQKDLNERNHQVALMHKIYSKAQKTLIWIGKADFGSDLVFKELGRIAGDDKRGEASDTTAIFGEHQLKGIPAIVRLIDREWFHRLWTVQEVLLAKDADIFCGWDMMTWKDFVRATHLLYQRDLAPGRRLSLLDQGRFDSFLVLTSGSLEMSRESNRDPYLRLTNLLLALRPRDSLDPSDKVYGLSGLVCSSDGKQIIKTNYHKRYDEVFAMATRLAIENTNSLDILGASGSEYLLDQKAQPTSSWVGDFVHRRRPHRPFRFTHEAAIRKCPPCLEAKAGDIKFEGDRLHIKGHFVDEIVAVAPVLTDFDVTEIKKRLNDGTAEAEQIEHDMKIVLNNSNSSGAIPSLATKLKTKLINVTQGLRVLKAVASANADVRNIDLRNMFGWYLESVQTFLDWEELAGLDFGDSNDSEGEISGEDDGNDTHEISDDSSISSDLDRIRSSPRWDEYWQTIAGGNLLHDEAGNDDLDASRDAFAHFYKMLAATRNLRRRGIANDSKLHRLLNLAGYMAGQYSTRSEYPKLLAHAQGRRLARTAAGRLVLVAEYGKVGDRLAFCKGARVPLVFRDQSPQGTRYVGEAYCHALVDTSLEEVQWQDIYIV